MTIQFGNILFFIRWKIRRTLPEAWTGVPERRRVSLLGALLRQEGEAGQLEALRLMLRLRVRTWRRIGSADKAAMLKAVPWLCLQPSAVPILPTVACWLPASIRPTCYLMPDPKFANGSCLEFALADEYLEALLKGDGGALPLLTATLLREPDPDQASALKREDLRARLHGRLEVEARAARQKALPDGVHTAVLLYFIGVKQLVHRLYGAWLFEQPGTEDGGQQKAPDPLRWWGMFMDAAACDLARLETIQQGSFHSFCTMEVRRRKQEKEAAMRLRMQQPDFGINHQSK